LLSLFSAFPETAGTPEVYSRIPGRKSMSQLSIKERCSESVVILDLKGQIKLGDGNVSLRLAVNKLIGRGVKNVLINLAGVTTVDSCGLGEIVSAYVSFRKTGGMLKLLGVTNRIQDLMVITKLVTVLNCYKTESDGVKSFRNFFNAAEGSKMRTLAPMGYTGL
jgi:anti-sigma B factor antagonist